MSHNTEQVEEQFKVSALAHEPGFATAAAMRAVAFATLEVAEQTRINNLCWMLDHVEGDEYERRVAEIKNALGFQ